MLRRTLLALPFATRAQAQPADGLLVFAAASLTEAMQDVARLWDGRVRFNFAASSTLARQLEQGAAAHVFASADEAWMDWAAARGLIVAETRRSLLGNRLVLVAPADRARPVAVGPETDWAALLGPGGRLAVGDPASVPAGIYARTALTRLGHWAAVEPRLARAESVRAALLLVERGEAPFGIVYATDAAVARGVTVVGSFDAALTGRISYPFAVTRAGEGAAARRFMALLETPAAREAFARRGFVTE